MSWELTGNSGTDPNINFLGTIDNQSLVIRTNGVPRLRVDASGNIGIGTTSPKDTLTVNGNSTVGKAQSSAGSASAVVYDEGSGYVGFQKRGTTQTGNMGLGNNASEIVSTSGNLGLFTYTSGYLALGTNNSERLRVDTNGNVGIGITNPRAKLDIFSGFDTDVLVFGRSAGDYHSITTSFHGSEPSLNYLGFNVEHNSSDVRRVLTLQGDGNVGIGVKNPTLTLDVQGRIRLRDGIGGLAVGTAGLWFNTANDFGAGGIADIGFFGAVDPTRIGLYGNDPRGGSQWGFTFDTVTGNVGIGTGTAYPSQKLQVNGNILAQGDVQVTGDIKLLGADCAECFDVSGMELLEPGTVMVITEEGVLEQSRQAYDKKVAGVISGAGTYKAGIVLDTQESRVNRIPIALVGKTYCKAEAQHGPIEVGDLLTTSTTAGHAMKAGDPQKAFGAVIGKALRPLKVGQGIIPILIALQ